MRSLVKGGQIVTAVQTYFADVLIEDERIAATGFFDPQSVDRVIDATGKLPGGVQFEKPAGLKKLLVTNYRDQFETTATEKFLTYALGRGLEYYDKPAVRIIMKQAARDNFRISALISAIVSSTPFQMRRTQEP